MKGKVSEHRCGLRSLEVRSESFVTTEEFTTPPHSPIPPLSRRPSHFGSSAPSSVSVLPTSLAGTGCWGPYEALAGRGGVGRAAPPATGGPPRLAARLRCSRHRPLTPWKRPLARPSRAPRPRRGPPASSSTHRPSPYPTSETYVPTLGTSDRLDLAYRGEREEAEAHDPPV